MYSNRKNGKSPPDELKQEHIEELHYICPIANLASILSHGILSHKRASKISQHRDISDNQVQNRRAHVLVPRADKSKRELALHRHVNFYSNAHNAMMYVRKNEHESLCVLRIRRELLHRGDTVFSTRNSSTNAVTFFTVEKNPLYSPRSTNYLTCPRVEGYDNEGKQIRQAEVLFPYAVDAKYIGGIFVSCESGKGEVEKILNESNRADMTVNIHPSMFFQGNARFISLEPFDPLAPLSEIEQEQFKFDLPESSESESSDNESADVMGCDF